MFELDGLRDVRDRQRITKHKACMKEQLLSSVKESSIKITRLPPATGAKIVSIDGGRAVWERLNEVGLHIGDRITVIRRAPFRGPLLVQCNGQEIALGRSIAAKILVQMIA